MVRAIIGQLGEHVGFEGLAIRGAVLFALLVELVAQHFNVIEGSFLFIACRVQLSERCSGRGL